MKYQECMHIVKLSEKAERFDQMVEWIKKAAKKAKESSLKFGIEERNLLSVAYKNQVGSRRSSWRTLAKILQESQTAEPRNEENLRATEEYIRAVEEELNEICDDALSLLDVYLLDPKDAPDARVFYLKMKGDYFRYKAEVAKGEKLAAITKEAGDAYEEATEIANASLPYTNPTRLGLYLNYSVFCFEILNEKTKAVNMGKEAFDHAIAELDNLTEESYKDSTLIMQLLRDNLSLWAAEFPEEVRGQ